MDMMTDEKSVLSEKQVDTTQGKTSLEKPKVSTMYLFFKRAFDFISSFAASLVLLLPILIISLLIVLKDKGNPFYAQKRVGLNGQVLKVYKFRSMKIGSDNLEKMLTAEQLKEYLKEYKLKDDPRLIGYKKAGDGNTCFGAILRKTSLDEILQILMNVCILGNMSWVGPRPILESELHENYTPEEQKLILSVKPGITGYWQAYARNNVTYESGERQKMELYYVYNRSFLLDLKIMFKTVESVITKTGAN